MNDTRAKLEQLFRRLSDPSVSDLDALADFVWFRKLRLDAKDVGEALGAPTAPTQTGAGTGTSTPTPANDGPMWPFKKRHAGESIAHIARTDPDYLRYFLGLAGKDALREPLLGQVRAALGLPALPTTPAAPKPVSQDFENP